MFCFSPICTRSQPSWRISRSRAGNSSGIHSSPRRADPEPTGHAVPGPPGADCALEAGGAGTFGRGFHRRAEAEAVLRRGGQANDRTHRLLLPKPPQDHEGNSYLIYSIRSFQPDYHSTLARDRGATDPSRQYPEGCDTLFWGNCVDNPTTVEAIDILAEAITQEVRPDEMTMIRDASQHSESPQMPAKGGLLTFGSPQEITLLFDATKIILTTILQEGVKFLGAEMVKGIHDRSAPTSQESTPGRSQELLLLLKRYEHSLRQHGFDREEAVRATDCLSRTLLTHSELLTALLTG